MNVRIILDNADLARFFLTENTSQPEIKGSTRALRYSAINKSPSTLVQSAQG
jgi:hypothetical protein